MVYSTCTINKGENIELIEKFIKSHPDMKMDKIESEHILGRAKEMGNAGYIEVFPDTDNSDGFFVCRLKKL
jgi:16S rRNA (cytosine967-C5)-methyltransferase